MRYICQDEAVPETVKILRPKLATPRQRRGIRHNSDREIPTQAHHRQHLAVTTNHRRSNPADGLPLPSCTGPDPVKTLLVSFPTGSCRLPLKTVQAKKRIIRQKIIWRQKGKNRQKNPGCMPDMTQRPVPAAGRCCTAKEKFYVSDQDYLLPQVNTLLP